MSSDSFIVYFGLRFEVASNEIEGVELRSDPRIIAARKVGLKYYWGNFGEQGMELLFVGYQIGILGAENASSFSLPLNDFQIAFDETIKKLREADFSETPELHLAWQPDI
jgi:hypothetical protein